MCGIIGIIGQKRVYEQVRLGLKSMEYRGYDSCGILIDGHLVKVLGSVSILPSNFDSYQCMEQNETGLLPDNDKVIVGLGHTRWATHGPVCIKNTHPIENDEGFAVHNGVVENVKEFEKLHDHQVTGDTDTEQVLHVFTTTKDLQGIADKLQGMSAFLFVLKDEPNRVYFLCKGLSSLYIGKSDDYVGICSDASVLNNWFDEAIVVQDGQFGYLEENNVTFLSENKSTKMMNVDKVLKTAPHPRQNTWLEQEIQEQPLVIQDTYKTFATKDLEPTKQVVFIGCGSAYYAGEIAAWWANHYGISSGAIVASEFDEYLNVLHHYQDALFVFISQSGQTIETIEAADKLKRAGDFRSLAIVNSPNTTLEHYTQQTWRTNAGKEVSVASTKAFTCQLAACLALVGSLTGTDFTQHIERIAADLEQVEIDDKIIETCKLQKSMYVLSKGLGVKVAWEIALKVKELAYIHTSGFSASEFKHGPLALVDQGFLGLMLNPSCGVYDRINSNAAEILARKGQVIMFTDKPFDDDRIIFQRVPATDFICMPFIYAKVGQLLAFKLASKKGYSIDRPRNLVKSVTVI